MFFFIASILMILVMFMVLCLMCKQANLKTLVIGLAIQQFQNKIECINALAANNPQPCMYHLGEAKQVHQDFAKTLKEEV